MIHVHYESVREVLPPSLRAHTGAFGSTAATKCACPRGDGPSLFRLRSQFLEDYYTPRPRHRTSWRTGKARDTSPRPRPSGASGATARRTGGEAAILAKKDKATAPSLPALDDTRGYRAHGEATPLRLLRRGRRWPKVLALLRG